MQNASPPLQPAPLLRLKTIEQYRQYYERYLCNAKIYSHDGIRIHFKPKRFRHAFFENLTTTPSLPGKKDAFSWRRAQYLTWLRPALEQPNTAIYMGWQKNKQQYSAKRRVCIAQQKLVIVVELSLSKKNQLKGNFITCYIGSKRSLQLTQNSPHWNLQQCLLQLRQQRN